VAGHGRPQAGAASTRLWSRPSTPCRAVRSTQMPGRDSPHR